MGGLLASPVPTLLRRFLAARAPLRMAMGLGRGEPCFSVVCGATVAVEVAESGAGCANVLVALAGTWLSALFVWDIWGAE